MATVHEKPRPAPRPSRYDAVVERNIERARARIRTLDLTVGLLGFLAGTLGFAVVMAILDRWLDLPSLVRQLAFGGYLVAALGYLVWAVVLPLTRRLNPYYAARQVEQSIPEAKNSVINWLDLHDDNLPAAIHGALGARAARDIAQVDLEQAISSRRATWLGGTVGVLFLTLIVLVLVWGAKPFISLLGRTFAPFVETTIATRTRLTVLRPEGGDALVPVDQSVYVAVQVEGRVPETGRPDSLRLLLRYQQSDPYEEQPLERETGREWVTIVPAFRVQNGFFYKVKGGDTETPEYRVRVRATPMITGFDVAYHYRPYLGFQDDTSRDPNLKAHRGTQVVLTARTNRTVRATDSVLEINMSGVKKSVPAEAVEDDAQALRFTFVIEQDGAYRVRFTTVEGEKNTDPMPYTIQAMTDQAPQVVVRKPGQDVTLPVNGLLKLEGAASDDIGVAAIALRMRVEGGPVLKVKPYRNGKDFRLADNTHPRVLEYRDFVELAKLVDVNDRPVALAPKMVIEYWLEAKDGCDYPPGPNTGESKKYKVMIAESPPLNKQQQDRQRQQAEQEQKQHEAQQDQQIARENEARKEGGANKPNPEPGEKPNPEEEQRKEEMKRQEEQIRDALKKLQEEKAGAKGDPEPDNKGNTKPDGQNDPKEQQQPDAGEGKKPEKPEENKGAGGAKGGGEQQGAGEAKGGGAPPMAGPDDRGGNKGAGEMQPGAGEGQAKPGIPDKWDQGKPGRGKDNGLPPEERLGRENDGAAPNKGENRPQAKDGAGAGEGDDAPAGSKDDPMRLTRSGNKDGGPKGEQRGGAKGNPDGGRPNEQARAKPEGEKNGDVAQAEKKTDGDGDGEKKPEEAKKEDVDRLAKKSRSGKGKEKEAKKQLEEVRDKARDLTAREAAKRELEKQRREEEPGLARENDKPKEGECAQCKGGGQGGNGPTKPGECAQCKGGGAGGGANPGEGKPGGGNEGGGVARGTGKGGNDQTTARKPGDGPGAEDEPNVVAPPDPLPKGQIDPEHARKVAELQLEEFRKKVNKKVLDDAKISRDDFERFLRGWVEMKRKQGLLPQDDEKLPGPQRGGALPSVGASKVTAGNDRGADIKAGGRGKAPPGFQDIVNKFTRDLSSGQDTKPEKK